MPAEVYIKLILLGQLQDARPQNFLSYEIKETSKNK